MQNKMAFICDSTLQGLAIIIKYTCACACMFVCACIYACVCLSSVKYGTSTENYEFKKCWMVPQGTAYGAGTFHAETCVVSHQSIVCRYATNTRFSLFLSVSVSLSLWCVCVWRSRILPNVISFIILGRHRPTSPHPIPNFTHIYNKIESHALSTESVKVTFA